MIPFADVADLEARWKTLSDDEAVLAKTKLDDASMRLRSLRRDLDEAVESDPLLAHAAMRVVCAMVERAMKAPAGMEGVSQFQQTGGPFSQNLTFSNPTGDLYLTKAEKVELGIGGQRAFSVDLLAEDET